jgi:hypothetical protein
MPIDTAEQQLSSFSVQNVRFISTVDSIRRWFYPRFKSWTPGIPFSLNLVQCTFTGWHRESVGYNFDDQGS